MTYRPLIEGKTSQLSRTSGCHPHLYPFCNSCIYLTAEFSQFSLLNTLSVLILCHGCDNPSLHHLSLDGLLTDIPTPCLFPFLSSIRATEQGYFSIRKISLCHPLLKMIQWQRLTHRTSGSEMWNAEPLGGNTGCTFLPVNLSTEFHCECSVTRTKERLSIKL